MIRTLITIAFASFILAVACLAGAAALGGRDIAENGWTVPSEWAFRVSDDGEGQRIKRVPTAERASRDLPWSGGEALVLDLPADVTYEQSETPGVTVTGPRDIVDRVVVDGGRITFAGDEAGSDEVTIDLNGVRIVDVGDRLRITARAPSVKSFSVNGSGDLDIIAYDQPSLRVEVQGSGNVSAAGRTEAASVDIVGSGSVDLGELRTRDATVETSGSGDAILAAKGAVKVAIAGSGGVSLRAKPASLTSEISGSGDVDQDY